MNRRLVAADPPPRCSPYPGTRDMGSADLSTADEDYLSQMLVQGTQPQYNQDLTSENLHLNLSDLLPQEPNRISTDDLMNLLSNPGQPPGRADGRTEGQADGQYYGVQPGSSASNTGGAAGSGSSARTGMVMGMGVGTGAGTGACPCAGLDMGQPWSNSALAYSTQPQNPGINPPFTTRPWDRLRLVIKSHAVHKVLNKGTPEQEYVVSNLRHFCIQLVLIGVQRVQKVRRNPAATHRLWSDRCEVVESLGVSHSPMSWAHAVGRCCVLSVL